MNNKTKEVIKYPVVLGLCGRSGSGKGYVSELFGLRGIPSIDTDKVYREITTLQKDGSFTDCMRAIRAEFGDSAFCEDGSLNRKALSDIVFANDGENARKKLNDLTHKYILEEAEKRIYINAKSGAKIVIVDAPLLFESGYNKKCDAVIAALAPESTLVRRLMRRDGLTEDDALRRLSTQLSSEKLEKLSDYSVYTDADRDKVLSQVDLIIEKLKDRFFNER